MVRFSLKCDGLKPTELLSFTGLLICLDSLDQQLVAISASSHKTSQSWLALIFICSNFKSFPSLYSYSATFQLIKKNRLIRHKTFL